MPGKDRQFRIYLKGKDRTEDVLDYERIDDKYKVRFTDNKTYKYNESNVLIIESVLNDPKSRECFDYLNSIADARGIKIKVDEEEVINILSHNYSKIDFVMPDSIFGAFLCGKLPETNPHNPMAITDIVYPFGFNASQKDAVDRALANKLSIIEGPPGTGKTQTILNIIANAVMQGESVAVVSSNNSATKNILGKLQKYNVDFIAAYLGNKDNNKEFH
ncbi:MAG: AAA family ATPase [Syntrophobacterales bacterium]|nr:AAA family ATPase [Syntrophobacterales bacterium]